MRVARPVVHLSLLFAAALILLFFGAHYSPAQDISSLQNGIVPFGTYDSGDIDTVNISSGNLNIHIPLFNYPQRGTLPGQFQIIGNTKSFYVVQSCNPQLQTCTLRWNMQLNNGVQIAQVSDELGLQTPWRSNTSNGLRVVSTDGSSHEMWGGQSLDGTGIYMNSAFPPTEFLNRNGNGLPSTSGTITQQDTNGNYFNTSGVDTLGRTISSFPGPNGSTTQVQSTSVNVTIQTNFRASSNDMYQNLDPIQEYGPIQTSLLQSIAVHDGNSWATSPTWTFQYNDRDPGDPSNINYGNVTQITLPTGGTISYTYGRFSPCDGSYLPLTPTSRGVISRTVNANDGTGPHTTTYYPNGTVTDPEGNQTAHTFTALASCSFYETQTQYYQGAVATGHLLKTVQTSYAYKSNPNCVNSIDDCQTVVSVVPTTITTTLDNGLVNKVVNVWDHQTGSGYTYGELLEKQEYDYGNGSPGPLLRKTDYTYLALNNSSYLALNMLDRVSSITVYNGSGTQVSQTTYGYDETSPVSSGISTNHLSLPSGTLRGNRTSECRWLNTTGGTLCTHTTFYDTGMPYQVTDPNGNVTTYSYSSTYAGAYVTQTTMPPTGSVQHITSAVFDFDTGKLTTFADQNGQPSSYQYDSLWRMTTASFPDGGQTTFTYPNLVTIQRNKNITTSLVRTDVSIFDDLGRPIQTQLTSDPQGTVYTDTTYDALGRVATVSNPYRTGTDITTTTGTTTYGYDALSRKTSETYPDGSILTTAYCGPTTLVTDPTGRWRRSTTDALGRLMEVDEPNAPGATVNSNGCPGTGEPIWVTSYTNDTLDSLTQVIQNGSRNRSFVYDSLKRLTTSTNPEAGTVTYSYDPNGNVVVKTDARGTSSVYYYDALNRLLAKRFTDSTPGAYYLFDGALPTSSATTSGAGSVTITGSEQSFLQDCPNPPCQTVYDSGTVGITVGSYTKTVTYHHGSAPTTIASALAAAFNSDLSSPVSATSSGAVVSFTARLSGILTNYPLYSGAATSDSYDFPDGSFGTTQSGQTLSGGSGTCTGTGITMTVANGIGRRSAMCDAGGAEAWTFDAMGRELSEQRTTIGITKSTSYTYNQDGSIATLTYPTGRVVNYTYNAANRPITAADGSNGVTYATDFQTAPAGCLSGAVCYTPQGTFYALSIGQSSSFTGLNLTHSYNNRLQPLEFKASSTGGNAVDITYSFVDPATSHNAGHVFSIANNLDTTRSQTFGYDQLNRITSGLTTSTHATSPTHCWGETYSVDAWGNLQSIAATTNSNYTGCSQESGFSANADGNNHLSGFSYDLSGNTQNDGVNSYTWDAESQLKTAAGVTYAYDGDGRRVSKVGSKLYWYGSGGEILAETDASGNTTAEYIFFGGKRVAQVPASGNPIYYVEDLLGTSRVITTNTGVVCYDADFYPYGGERPYTNTCPQNYKFEGKERDTETGNDDFGARYYSNRFGRWLSADWSSIPEPVPYANLANPQTLNLYAMVADDPESFADLDGHDGWDFLAQTIGGIENAINENNGINTGSYQPSENALGRAIGNAISVVQGGVEVLGGAAAVVTGGTEALAASPTVVGSAPGVALAGVGVVGVVHGSTVLKNALENSSSGASTDSKPHGNTAGDQPAELYEKHDANGNFEKHGVSQDASKRYSKKEVNGGTVKVTDRGPRKEMLKKERQKVETNPGPKNKEPWAGKKKKPTDQ